MVVNFTLFFFCSSLRLGSDWAELDLALNSLSTSKNLSKYLLDILPFFLKIGRRSTAETFKLFVCTFILGSIWNAYAHLSNFLGSELKALKSQIFSRVFSRNSNEFVTEKSLEWMQGDHHACTSTK